MLSEVATYTNLIIFRLTRTGRKPMIYCTPEQHANHYTTDTVLKSFEYELT